MEINYIAVFAATIASFIFGMLWYSPLLFGKQWMELSGMKKKMKKKQPMSEMMPSMLGGFVTSFVMAAVFSVVMAALGMYKAAAGYELTQNMLVLKSAFFVWLGFFATTQLGSVLWEKRPCALYVLNTAYSLINLMLIGFVLVQF